MKLHTMVAVVCGMAAGVASGMEWTEALAKSSSNIGLVKGPVRGILIEHHGCGCANCQKWKDTTVTNYSSFFSPSIAQRGWILIHSRYGSKWMDDSSIRLTDELIDAYKRQYGLKADVPIISTGYSMGGMGALAWPIFSRHRANIRAVFANCPAANLVAQYRWGFFNENGEKKRADTIYRSIEAGYPRNGLELSAYEQLLKVHSPLDNVERMPKVPYYINHAAGDPVVRKASHSDLLVPKMRAAGLKVEYLVSDTKSHCGFTKDTRKRYFDAVDSEMAQAVLKRQEGVR